MSGGGEEEKTLEKTPSWAVALVCTVFVVASLLVERGIHKLGRYFKRSNQRELYHTLEVIKNELMVLGFISLFLSVFQQKVASLCMAERLNRIMLPCKYVPPAEANAEAESPAVHRRLFAVEAQSSGTCSAGHVQVISEEGLHQLHIFIFVMAVVHVLYSCLTVLVGLWQVHSWKKWEVGARNERLKAVNEALTPKHRKHEHGDEFTKGRIRYKFLYTSRTGLNLDSYIYSFFRQFGKPIYKEDYLCLRMGFIATHELNAEYDFHSYIRRTMEEDFKTVVGISSYLWAFVCLFLLLDVDGWYTYFWIAFIPTFLVLIVGTKLQQIIINLALEVRGGVEKIDISTSGTIDGSLKAAEKPKQEVVCQPMRPRDDLFWFRKPHFLIHLVHFVLFQV
ncbi:MLO-like protein 15 isoform X2 [Physcomitrium patens]|uniref:MLO-like protein 15 isoform X2 n=1 Tax=Physcomitrium patens TaxID=3218 RepID=UPI003CCD38DF